MLRSLSEVYEKRLKLTCLSLGNFNPKELKSSSNVLVMVGNLRISTKNQKATMKTLPNDDSPTSEASKLTPLSLSNSEREMLSNSFTINKKSFYLRKVGNDGTGAERDGQNLTLSDLQNSEKEKSCSNSRGKLIKLVLPAK